jgi:hypothetical protein
VVSAAGVEDDYKRVIGLIGGNSEKSFTEYGDVTPFPSTILSVRDKRSNWRICLTMKKTKKKPTCIFEVKNAGPGDLVLALEPEGCEFLLPLNERVQVHVFGSDVPVLIQAAISKDGKRYMAFWPDRGEYELFFKGRRVWDIIEDKLR